MRVTFFILGEFFNLWYGDIWWYFMVFALIFYYIAITGYANSVETQVYLTRLENDLVEVLNASIDGKLDQVALRW